MISGVPEYGASGKTTLSTTNEEEYFPLHDPPDQSISEVRAIMTARQDLLFLLHHRVRSRGENFKGSLSALFVSLDSRTRFMVCSYCLTPGAATLFVEVDHYARTY